ncbi:MAG: hypothetical protein KDI20_09180 [Pseudomonadales bacterium]|nr:hypothetical protein [Pseudomonadales bacterium]
MESHWYFSTREGTDVGPFDSRDEASSGLQDFIQFIQLANHRTLHNFLNTLASNRRHKLTA